MFAPSFRQCSPSPCPPTETDPNIYAPAADHLSVVISYPLNNQEVPANFTVIAQINGPHPIVAVEFWLEGDKKCTVYTTSYSCSMSWPGPYGSTLRTIKVKAYDNSGDSKEESIKVKITGPP